MPSKPPRCFWCGQRSRFAGAYSGAFAFRVCSACLGLERKCHHKLILFRRKQDRSPG